eukprot:CAMPEP_0204835272 /NCGR_PEP_ID=MMETSP1346-20131115/22117_1 /ASSEMBLY_ACC=CAM_ASM_000771 /TAXON_ID=215587 /ORGANISM="Aplanochytrium stocchinoi, Strain GSBS06" /LENGTH=72 /DNA_ID=CAMNT_0051969133 /DNA_START=91 /DNA_END=306 /DNA_ORIENTATION=-
MTRPRSFSVFVTVKSHPRVRTIQDIVDKKFLHIGVNDCAASGAGVLVDFANRWDVTWRKEFYGGKNGGSDSE